MTDIEDYLQYATLEGKKSFLLNGQKQHKHPLPKEVTVENMENALYEACAKDNMNYVSPENVKRWAIEINKQYHHLARLPKHREQAGAEKPKEKKNERYECKYHSGDMLAEAALAGREPMYIVSNAGKISIEQYIDISAEERLKPPEAGMYITKPYVYESREAILRLVEKCNSENPDTVYHKIKSVWAKYIEAEDAHLAICSADTFFTYFQDKIGLTHYLFFIGGNNSGKSNNLHVFNFLAYRNMNSTDVTPANIYQMLGGGEEGTATLCEDEADDIDQDREKMRIYKNGYTTGFKVMRTDTSFGRRQYAFNTFCFKAFAAERLPDALKGKGFNQRVIELHCTYGIPQFDISEIINPAGEQEYKELLDELNDVRNMLLIYRLLHHHEPISKIRLSITGREKQLFGPILRVFQNSQILDALMEIASKFLSQKRQKNIDTLAAFLYKTVSELIKAQNTRELESTLIWETVKNLLPGTDIPHKPLSYMSAEHGELSQKEVVKTLKEVFGAEKSPNKRERRKLLFAKEKMERLDMLYNLSVEVKVSRDSGADVAHGADIGDIGLDRFAKIARNKAEIGVPAHARKGENEQE